MKRLLVFLVLMLSVSLAFGSYITFSVTLSSDSISGDSGKVNIRLDQRGDEPAYEIVVFPLASDHFSYDGRIYSDKLNPGESLEGSFTVFFKKNLTAGAYPFITRSIYHDSNMHPFSVVSYHHVVYKEKFEPKISGSIEGIELPENSMTDFMLKVRNLENDSKEVTLKLYLPEELRTEKETEEFSLGPGEEKHLIYRIESSGALVGSYYSVLASMEYENDYHYTSFTSGTVRIVERKSILGVPYEWVIVILIALVVIFVIYQVWGVLVEKKKSE
ncbi:MAG: hypothetical protein JSV92_03010 [archaeon]|nr:MAG: hypothetical protein JSV92_03010 [archaeon]